MASIDEEHRRIFELVGRLEAAVRAAEAPAGIEQLLQQTLAFLKFHFHGEEQLLGIVAYPRLAGHRAEHASLSELVGSLAPGGLTTSRLAFVWAALCQHFDSADRAYVAWLTNPRP